MTYKLTICLNEEKKLKSNLEQIFMLLMLNQYIKETHIYRWAEVKLLQFWVYSYLMSDTSIEISLQVEHGLETKHQVKL